jgi:protein-tyrosine phosphatase
VRTATSVMFVCTGNICRSVMAERILRSRLQEAGMEDVVVDSVGISDEEFGNPVDPRAVTVLTEAGYDAAEHSARQATAQLLAERDLAIAMTLRHRRALERLVAPLPDGQRPEIRMFRSFDPACEGLSDAELDVSDPWYGTQDDFCSTLEMLEAGMPGLIEEIRARRT